jgi:hypothetical protein
MLPTHSPAFISARMVGSLDSANGVLESLLVSICVTMQETSNTCHACHSTNGLAAIKESQSHGEDTNKVGESNEAVNSRLESQPTARMPHLLQQDIMDQVRKDKNEDSVSKKEEDEIFSPIGLMVEQNQQGCKWNDG